MKVLSSWSPERKKKLHNIFCSHTTIHSSKDSLRVAIRFFIYYFFVFYKMSDILASHKHHDSHSQYANTECCSVFTDFYFYFFSLSIYDCCWARCAY